MIRTIILYPLFILIGFFSACSHVDQQNDTQVKIAISKAVPFNTFENYINWLKYADSTVKYVDMYHLSVDSALLLLRECDGLLLTGGTDIYPGRYGKEHDTARCWKPDFKRDTLEFALLDAALKNHMPVMGICRGHQLINVHFGGSLYIDIPQDLDTLIKHQLPDTYDCIHEVELTEGSILARLSGNTSGTVNSNHHQGIEKLADMLNGLALTEDNLIESIELSNPEEGRFLLGVQWHPERMNYSNPLSGKIAIQFTEAARQYAIKSNNNE